MKRDLRRPGNHRLLEDIRPMALRRRFSPVLPLSDVVLCIYNSTNFGFRTYSELSACVDSNNDSWNGGAQGLPVQSDLPHRDRLLFRSIFLITNPAQDFPVPGFSFSERAFC
jgi:hypothetical protein